VFVVPCRQAVTSPAHPGWHVRKQEGLHDRHGLVHKDEPVQLNGVWQVASGRRHAQRRRHRRRMGSLRPGRHDQPGEHLPGQRQRRRTGTNRCPGRRDRPGTGRHPAPGWRPGSSTKLTRTTNRSVTMARPPRRNRRRCACALNMSSRTHSRPSVDCRSALTFFAHLIDVPSGRAVPAANPGRVPVAYPMRSPEPAQAGGEPLQRCRSCLATASMRSIAHAVTARQSSGARPG
jgi:hypothetical protein